jgi:hypothetical protein
MTDEGFKLTNLSVANKGITYILHIIPLILIVYGVVTIIFNLLETDFKIDVTYLYSQGMFALYGLAGILYVNIVAFRISAKTCWKIAYKKNRDANKAYLIGLFASIPGVIGYWIYTLVKKNTVVAVMMDPPYYAPVNVAPDASVTHVSNSTVQPVVQPAVQPPVTTERMFVDPVAQRRFYRRRLRTSGRYTHEPQMQNTESTDPMELAQRQMRQRMSGDQDNIWGDVL